MRFEGSFSDGRSAAATPVEVELTADGLRIHFRDGRPPTLWPYARLRAADGLKPGHEAPLMLQGDPARLFVSETGFVSLLLTRAPHLKPRRWPIVLAIIAVLVVAVALPVWLLGRADVSPARMIADRLPERILNSIGDSLIDGMTKGRVCADPQGEAALRALVERLAGEDAAVKRVVVGPLGMVNAFAVPGGRIVISRELLARARTPEEVAGVLAHEIGHVIAGHPKTALVRSVGIMTLVGLLSGGSDVAAELVAWLVQTGYSRAAEREADDIALQLLKRAGVSAAGLAAFLERLRAKGDGDLLPEIFSTHPATRRRLDTIRKAGDWPARPALTTAQWRALKSICASAE